MVPITSISRKLEVYVIWAPLYAESKQIGIIMPSLVRNPGSAYPDPNLNLNGYLPKLFPCSNDISSKKSRTAPRSGKGCFSTAAVQLDMGGRSHT